MMVIIFGYDPGGETGLAVVRRSSDGLVSVETASAWSVDQAVNWTVERCGGEPPTAAGIDTYLCWATGRCGWRPMDERLRRRYEAVEPSVFSSNSAYGAMAVQGMALAIELRHRWGSIHLNETHPKVLYHACTGGLYLRADITPMTEWLRMQFSPPAAVTVKNEHQWDALISAWATLEGLLGNWAHDLVSGAPKLLYPAGPVTYFWPEAIP